MSRPGFTGLDLATYLVALVYMANFFALSAVAAHAAGRSVWLLHRTDVPGQRLTALAFRVSFGIAFLWPGLRLLGEAAGLTLGTAAWIPSWFMSFCGHLLVAVGAAIALLSQHHMGQAWRIGAAEGAQGSNLVESGPFALSRNPVFIGQAVLLLGLLLAFPDPVQAGAALGGWTAMHRQTFIEERVLRASFGAGYDAYAMRVPRWLRFPFRGSPD